MSPLDINAIPNPPNSPIEKLLGDTVWENIEPHVRSALSENPTKDEILRAFSYYDRVLADYIQRHEDALTYWANTHTHDFGASAPLSFLVPPFRVSGSEGSVSGSTSLQTSPTGDVWTPQQASSSEGTNGAYNGDYFIVAKGSRNAYSLYDKNDMAGIPINANCDGSTSNSDYVRNVLYNYNTGRTFMPARGKVFYTDQSVELADENWIPVVTGSGAIAIGIEWDPLTDTYFVMTSTGAYFSTDHGLSWELGGATPGPSYSTFSSSVYGSVSYLNGRWLFGHKTGSANDMTGSGLFTTVDGGTWVQPLTGGFVPDIRSNGSVALACGWQEFSGTSALSDFPSLARSTDSIEWDSLDSIVDTALAGSARFPTLVSIDSKNFDAAAWDGTVWIAGGSVTGKEEDGTTDAGGPFIIYTTDPLALTGWQVSDYNASTAGRFLF